LSLGAFFWPLTRTEELVFEVAAILGLAKAAPGWLLRTGRFGGRNVKRFEHLRVLEELDRSRGLARRLRMRVLIGTDVLARPSPNLRAGRAGDAVCRFGGAL